MISEKQRAPHLKRWFATALCFLDAQECKHILKDVALGEHS